ncbi:MAG: 4Fe-4S ferredoxin, partial [Desulfococcus multivorans]|nr:4Fe-4S ferredoxin [Desulfococcus multivorans]
MTEPTSCNVNALGIWLKERLAAGDIESPRFRQQAAEISEHLADISQGLAEEDHLTAILKRADFLASKGETPETKAIGRRIISEIEENLEIFLGHIQSHTCPSGACHMLTPAPCQMACPAGIDIPSYLTLVG